MNISDQITKLRLTGLLTAFMLIPLCLPEQSQFLLYFSRSDIESGQWWRLITAHASHLNMEHLLWNGVAWVILGAVVERYSRRLLLLAFCSGIAVIDLLLLSPWAEFTRYCGLSGVLNSIFVAALWVKWCTSRSVIIPVLLAFGIGKILFEISVDDGIFTRLPWPPYPEAHLAGIAGGFAAVALFLSLKAAWKGPMRAPSKASPIFRPQA
ncbi:rhomboid family GlyGly-CTERM serine protease [Oleiphilus messinensis]|uniref:Rhomboid family GlyGly-CTERM serine protease n=1 Tax=Oleiphilus messinensis TaxID=141451 RepID=A0A1Y0I7B6_9GAMM|nr:rhombosortase [Oleiphilus messinensis]ARU56397.1 rhomboid family GlyGly-CTERM serine protease [Oleiphilus messinensis]